MAFKSVNPATGERVAEHPEAGPAEVEAVLGAAEAAAASWRLVPLRERAERLRAWAAALRPAAPDLAREAALEMGKPVREGLAEVAKCAEALEFLAESGAAWLAEEVVATRWRRSRVVPVPMGVVLAVMPWNYPYWQIVRAAGPALLAGNVMPVKAASNVQGCARRLVAAAEAAGLGGGVLSLLAVPGSAVGGVVRDRRVSAVTFTGSAAVGREVAAHAAAGPKKGVYELGGSDAYVVLADAELELAAETCAAARLVNAGQSCCALKRVVVERPVAEPFLERFVAAMARRRPADPLDPATELGPLASVRSREELEVQVASSVAAGARVVLGGVVPPGRGAFFPPTVLVGVTPGMAVAREETFGPVAAVLEAADEGEAVRLANASPYGIGAAVFTRDVERGRRLAEGALEAGLCFVNAQVVSDVRLPFGGVKASGHGRELGLAGVREFVAPRTVCEA